MSSSSSSSSFTLYLDNLHLGHLCKPSNSFLYYIQPLDKHAFFGTPYALDTISSWPRSDWSTKYYLLEVFHATIQAIQ